MNERNSLKKKRNKYEIANEKTFDKVRLIWFIIGITFFIFVIKPFENKLPFWNKERIEEEHVGVVSKKYIDKENHAARTIELKNQKGKIDLWHFREYYQIIEIGDSISKVKGDSIFQIFKKHETIHFKYQIE